MEWLSRKKKWLQEPVRIKLTNPMKDSRFPFSYPYPYVYDSPYAGTSEDKYSDTGGNGIKMDPEKYVGLGYKDVP